ncbi:germinal-center associated nuclear protein [Synchiropus splendidus]|uniref:germinal-center associated nuclear protein n=1 Tax=Synchiropus splendidus TaxID=270530 RepID=UPI00237D6B0A|nr:germinal-center associated nuclear protein [Synchiropus splendidus]
MNPSNPFGSLQPGAFQAASNTMKAGAFPTFGQQTSTTPPQAVGLFSSSAFSQPTGLKQNTLGGNSIFGQGLSSTTANPTPAFGQPVGMSSSGFGASTPAFGTTKPNNPSSLFGQNPAFGQTPTFGQQASGLVKQPPPYGQFSSGTGSSVGFGSSVFGKPLTTSANTNVFGITQDQNKGFGSDFSFKPANEAVFKPIFNASTNPSKPTSFAGTTFGTLASQTNSSTMMTGTNSFSQAQAAPSGFSFSKPEAAPSLSVASNQFTAGTTTGLTSTPQFTFSQPAAPSSSKSSTTQPTSPSSFSFAAKPLFGGGNAAPSAFGEVNPETSGSNKGLDVEAKGDTNLFPFKGTKRKEGAISTSPARDPAKQNEMADTDQQRQPPKRPLMRTRGPTAGLFGKALSGIKKELSGKAGQEPSRQPPPLLGEKEKDHKSELPVASPVMTAVTRDHQEKPTGSAPDPAKITTPVRQVQTPEKRTQRRLSSETLGGSSPTDCTALNCRNIPSGLNRKDELRKHFSHFGKVSRIFCKPAKNMAIVHFADHASAAKAKKKGKMFHQHELLLLWQRKKQSPENKTTDNMVAKVETREDVEQKAASSPLRRPQLRPPGLTSLVAGNQSTPVKKPTLAKCLQFDAEPQSETVSETARSEQKVPTSLLVLIDQVAETSEEKYRLLEQRDKILRQGRSKRTDLESSKGFVGTCPDMCPEKERYMRETRTQLSIFEVIQDTELVDHAKAVKEYSRSSADQEEPLPFELRPLPVLGRTMDYLITQIMDQGQDNPREWYDFVWNRTRSIRKDIIQQCLCCPLTVSLIEKCTRFHVHCAHSLCQESLSTFDPKINNENLTKCLQSLKEMYEDLKTRDIYCPQEAEFRQYSILIKLNDGDFLGDVQQYRPEVRNSPEVKFAVSAFAALNSNNYVLFFKLVKGASYLASCLLHRYFNQVRATALKIMAISYTVGPRSTLFPVEDIVRMLMFNSEAEATHFIQQYGLIVNDGMVELNRVNYQEPDLPLSPKKSQVTLAKKQVLIGEVVNGRPMPNTPQHTPVCSFDSRNKYRGEALSIAQVPTDLLRAPAEAVESEEASSFDSPQQALLVRPAVVAAFGVSAPTQVAGGKSKPSLESLTYKADPPQLFQPIAEPPPPKPPSPPPKPPEPEYTNEDVTAILDNVIDELITAGVKEIATDAISYVNTALEESCVQVESLVGEVTGQMLREVSTTEISLEQSRVAEERRRQAEARRRQEHEAFLDTFSSTLCTDFINQVVSETTQEIAVSEIQQALDEKERQLAECTREVCGSVIEETLDVEMGLLVEEVLEVELNRIQKYIKRWRDVVAVRRQLKRQMRSFPAAPCFVHPHSKLKALAPSAPAQPAMADLARGLVNLGNAGTLALSSTRLLRIRQEVIHRMRVHNFYQQLLEEVVWAPLDLPALVAKNLHDPPDRVFWKAVLLLPSDHETADSPADQILSNWLEVKLGGDPEAKPKLQEVDGKLETLCVSIAPRERDQDVHQVHVSVKASRGPLTEDNLTKMESCCELQGSSALVLLLPALPVMEQDVPLLSALLQLKQLQQANTWHCPLPLVILVPGHELDTGRLEEDLMLQTLKVEGLISEFTFLFIPESTNDLQGTKQLSHAVRWLLARAPPQVTLACQTLVQLVEASLSRELSPRVYSHSQERASAGLPPQHPAPVTRLYNSILAHIADGVSSPELSRLSWPPSEFCLPDNKEFVPHLGWNSPRHLAWLREWILSLQLPEWKHEFTTESWSEVCATISEYVMQIPASPKSQPLLISRLENLLERVRLKVAKRYQGELDHWVDEDQGLDDVFNLIPWEEVVEVCIDHKLKEWQILEPPVCQGSVTEDGEVLVYFQPDSLDDFSPPEEWTKAVRQTHQEKQLEGRRLQPEASTPSSQQRLRQKLFHSVLESLETPSPQLDISHTPTPDEALAHKVLQEIKEEKAENKRTMDQLQRWLDGEPLVNYSASLFLPSSTLLTTSPVLRPLRETRSRGSRFTESAAHDDLPEKDTSFKSSPVSMMQKLNDLEQKIRSSQQEEMACRLKLSGMLSIVDN